MAIGTMDTDLIINHTLDTIPEDDYNIIARHGGITINRVLDTNTPKLEAGTIWLGNAQIWNQSGEWHPTVNLNVALSAHKLPDTLRHELAHIILACEEAEKAKMIAPSLDQFQTALRYSLWDIVRGKWRKNDGHRQQWKTIYCRISGKNYFKYRAADHTPIPTDNILKYRTPKLLTEVGTLGKFVTKELAEDKPPIQSNKWRRQLKLIPQEFEGFNRVLTGVVVPRPIALVSTVSPEGVVNLAPFSFFNAIAYDPPTLVLGISRSAGWKAKDTLANIEATGEFVVNVVVDEIAAAMNATAAEYPADVDEFEVSGLTAIPSDVVRPPGVAESPVNMECRLNQVIAIGDEAAHALVIGEIALMRIRDDIISGHRIDHSRLKPVGRLAGNMYCDTSATYELARPVYHPDDAQSEQAGD